MLTVHQRFMQRCFDLARLGAGHTSPNPMVGAVLVHQGRIIGEGYHTRYGCPHAEVEAVRSVLPADRQLIPRSTLYVSLEPCSIFGRTPPCTDLILREKIPTVVVAHRDFSPGVNGRGIAILQEHGIEVIEGVLKHEGYRLSQARNVFVTQARPYVILKFAQSANGYIARSGGQPQWLSNSFSKRLVHQWRSEIDAIMIGTNTALLDNPVLNTRLVPGSSPIRVIPDRQLRLPVELNIFSDDLPTWIYTTQSLPERNYRQTEFISLPPEAFLFDLLADLQEKKVQTLMVEGGAQLLEWFLEQEKWDEARVIHTPHYLPEGLKAPVFNSAPEQTFQLQSDRLEVFYRE
ncbi:MAG: bifunctional diaminohydroxyphosphoribosylaminopyrimidine deaminase/5-amino-6-(5-phosphoribosylamino)uracil reductase RibD [Saprospiraceae bacterium]